MQGRWKTLVTGLKKTKDHNNKSGNDRKTCAFEKELDIMFEGNPSIKPAASSSSCMFPVQEKRKELDGNCTEADENDEKMVMTKVHVIQKLHVIKTRSSAKVIHLI